jgi:hypothetical protein
MLSWPVYVGIAAVVAITAVYFVWLRKPAATAEQQPQQQPQA